MKIASHYPIHISIIRSVPEYACPVGHPGLSKAQSNKIERVQKRSWRIIYPKLRYSKALLISGLHSLHTRRENITRDKLKLKIISFTRFYQNEKLHPWLSGTRIHIKSQLPKFRDMGKYLYQIVFQKDFQFDNFISFAFAISLL